MDPRLESFTRLLDIMDRLRAECPWDKKQTMETLRHLTIEEVYELSEAIIADDMEGVKKELGDIMLHLIFYSKIGSEGKAFDITDVLNAQCEKLIHRHPHIYGDTVVQDEEEVKRNWEQLKLKEGNISVLSGVPSSLPAMVKAIRIQEKAKASGFDWENKDQVWEKVQEEMGEFKHEMEQGDPALMEAEFGDLIFSMINLARFIDVNPDLALERTNLKFIKRFRYLEKEAAREGKKLNEMSLAEMDEYWNKAKNID